MHGVPITEPVLWVLQSHPGCCGKSLSAVGGTLTADEAELSWQDLQSITSSSPFSAEGRVDWRKPAGRKFTNTETTSIKMTLLRCAFQCHLSQIFHLAPCAKSGSESVNSDEQVSAMPCP